MSIDGKSIKGTVTGSQTADQNFVSLVWFYSSQQGIVLANRLAIMSARWSQAHLSLRSKICLHWGIENRLHARQGCHLW